MPVLSQDKPNTAAAIRWVESHWPGLKAFGWRPKGSVPNSDHPKGLALDVPVRDVGLGDEIAEWFLSNADAFGTTYVIWNRRTRKPGGQWEPYDGPSEHTDHVHISLAGGHQVQAPSGGGGGLLAGVVDPLLTGARETALTGVFAALGLGLIALGAWRGVRPVLRMGASK